MAVTKLIPDPPNTYMHHVILWWQAAALNLYAIIIHGHASSTKFFKKINAE